jgi:PAS domain S-box-containing protein
MEPPAALSRRLQRRGPVRGTGRHRAGRRGLIKPQEPGPGDAADHLDLFFELSTDLLCVAGMDGYLKRVNPAWEKTLGHPLAELLARPFVDFVHPDDAAATAAETARLATGALTVAFTNRFRCADGSYRSVSWNATPLPDEGVIYGIGRDISHLEQAEQRFRPLIQAAPDAMVIADETGRIVLVNQPAENLFGYSGAELVDQPVELLVPDRLRRRHTAHRRDFLTAPSMRGMGTDIDLRARHRDGREFPVEISLAPLDTDEGTLVCAAIRDTTERRLAEQALAQARDRALEAAQLKSQFVATVSHEIRTPMNAVIGLTDLLLRTPLDETQHRYATGIRTSGEALIAVINDILDLSRAEAGKITLAEVDFDLRHLLEDVTQIAAETARDKELEILTDYHPSLPRTVRGDPGRLRQILLNLAGNAVKFTGRGDVLVRAEPTATPTSGVAVPVRFEVTDTGPGIAPEVRHRLFEPFSQLDGSPTRNTGGTGLGLAICKQLTELMGGRIGVAGDPGRGSTFWFTVPLTPRVPAASSAAVTARVPIGGLRHSRVLLVDDNATNRDILTRQLGAWGARPTAFASGVQALEHLRGVRGPEQTYDVGVLDQLMPGMDGLELARRITSDPGIGPLPLILLTAGTHADQRAARAAGIHATLGKPVGPSHLYDCLIGLLAPPATTVPAPASSLSPSPPRVDAILLVEDNEINQIVAMETLIRLGYQPDLAHDGAEAVELAIRNSYRAVLMDCQMPTMDGYTATAEIRRREGTARHTPVIAMTASAFSEDRDRCLAAGMDDYITKPIDPDQLYTVLARWIAYSSPATSTDQVSRIREAVTHRLAEIREDLPPVSGDLASRLVRSFRTRVPETLTLLGAAVGGDDRRSVEEQAHVLKGVAGHLGAADLAALCDEMEAAARAGQLASAPELLTRIHAELDRVHHALDAL